MIKRGIIHPVGTLINGDDNLYSRRGTYLSRTKDLFFRDTVRLINPDYTMESDTLQYNILSKTATFLGTYLYFLVMKTLYFVIMVGIIHKQKLHNLAKELILKAIIADWMQIVWYILGFQV